MTSYQQNDPGADDTAQVVGRAGGGSMVWKVTTAVLAVAVVALAYLLSQASSRPGFADTAEDAAESACELLTSAQEDLGDEVFAGKLGLAQSLAFLAQAYEGIEGEEFRWLMEAAAAPRQIGSQDFDFDSEAVQEALQDSQDACADNGF